MINNVQQIEVIHSVDVHSCELDNIINKICELENIKPEDIYIFSYINGFDVFFNKYVRLYKHIPLKNNKLKNEIFIKNAFIDQHSRTYSSLLNQYFAWNPQQMNDKIDIKYVNRIYFYRYINNSIDHFSNNLFFVLKKDFKKLIKWTRIAEKGSINKIDPPILDDAMLLDIYTNSIGFLLNHKTLKKEYEKFNIPLKRGILLAGHPGSGKTLTCKWLRYLTKKHNFAHKVVDMQTYEKIRNKGNIETIFKLSKPGIIFFDDMDVMLKNRSSGNSEVVNFLTNLDGINPSEGVVFIFTTNIMEELEEASIRCGRIDLFKKFEPPNEILRRKYIEKIFNKELLEFKDEHNTPFNIDLLVRETNEYSFAELEEIRKMLAMDFVKTKKVRLTSTLALFKQHRSDFKHRCGFGIETEEDSPPDFYSTQEAFPWEND